jgi:hypothetical protein
MTENPNTDPGTGTPAGTPPIQEPITLVELVLGY